MTTQPTRRLLTVDEYHRMGEAGIPEYWIVNLEAGELEVYRSPLGERYQYREIVLSDNQVTLSSLGLTLTPRQLTG